MSRGLNDDARSRGVSSARPKTWARRIWTRCSTYGPAEAGSPQEIVTRIVLYEERTNGQRTRTGRWLGTTLRQSPATASDACLDAETLAAWADGGLSATGGRCRRAARVELLALHGGAGGDGAHALLPHPPTRAWTPARVFRWLAPLTAAATAVAIWVVVPDRPLTQVAPAPAHDMASRAPKLRARNQEPGPWNPSCRTAERRA